jgi:hypothetical protein
MRYREVLPISRQEAEASLVSDDSDRVIGALLSLAYFDEDLRWVEAQCVRLATHSDEYVRGTVATCLMHLARIHGTLDWQLVGSPLEALRADRSEWVSEQADAAIKDIHWYLSDEYRQAT